MSAQQILAAKTLFAFQNNSAPSVAVLLAPSQTLCQKSDARPLMLAARNPATARLLAPPPQLDLAAPALKAKWEIRTNQGVSQKEVAQMEIVIALIKVSASGVSAKTFAMTHADPTRSAPSITDRLSVNVYKVLSQVLWMPEPA